MIPAHSVSHGSCYVNAVSVHPQAPQFATAGDDGRVVCWDASTRASLWEVALSEGAVFDVRYTPSGEQLLAAGAGKAGVTCLRARDGKVVWAFRRRDRSPWGFSAAAMDPRERVVVAAPGDSRFTHVYALPKRSHELDYFHGAIGLRFSPDGRRVASYGEGVQIWNPFGKRGKGPGLRGGRTYMPPSWSLQLDVLQVLDVAFSPEGNECATVSSDGFVRSWPVERRDGKGQPTRELKLDAIPQSVSWSHDGRWVAVGDDAGRLSWIDTARWRIHTTAGAHTGAVRTVAFTPSDAWLLSGGDDGQAHLWQLPG